MAELENDSTELEDIHRLCPCRKQQIEKLLQLFGEKDELAFPNIFIHGNTGTGKSYVLKKLMSKLQVCLFLIFLIDLM